MRGFTQRVQRLEKEAAAKDFTVLTGYSSPVGFLKDPGSDEVWTDEERADATVVFNMETVKLVDGVAMILDPRNDEPWKPMTANPE